MEEYDFQAAPSQNNYQKEYYSKKNKFNAKRNSDSFDSMHIGAQKSTKDSEVVVRYPSSFNKKQNPAVRKIEENEQNVPQRNINLFTSSGHYTERVSSTNPHRKWF